MSSEEMSSKIIDILSAEIEKRRLDATLTLNGDLIITNTPTTISRFAGGTLTETEGGGTLYSIKPFKTETVRQLNLHYTIGAPFRLWFEDEHIDNFILKRHSDEIVNKINSYYINRLVEDSQKKNVAEFNNNTLSDFQFELDQPNIILMHPKNIFNFIREKFIIKNSENEYEINDMEVLMNKIIPEDNALFIRSEDIIIKKDKMEFIFYPQMNPKELHITQNIITGAFDNRGLGLLKI